MFACGVSSGKGQRCDRVDDDFGMTDTTDGMIDPFFFFFFLFPGSELGDIGGGDWLVVWMGKWRIGWRLEGGREGVANARSTEGWRIWHLG